METQRSEVLNISHLAKSFGRMPVLADIRFSVSAGDFVCLLGPSGCGKTTLLRTVAGLLPFEKGSVAIFGQEQKPQDCQKPDIGVIFQEPRLLPWRTTRGNVRLPFELIGQVTRENEKSIDDALELVKLTEFSKAYPHELSGGMRSRVSLARALATRPRILLMDEPLTGLDVRTRETLQDEITRIWAEKRMSLVWVTHDPEEAVYLADYVVVLSDRPTVVRGIVNVALPRPRKRGTEEFRQHEAEVRSLLVSAPRYQPIS